LLSKYGKREKVSTTQAIHRIAERLVEQAKTNSQAIVMERLKGHQETLSQREWSRTVLQEKDEPLGVPRGSRQME
jgi:IS605 OrfB family transposase